ncbi:MAG: hypothetical protein U0694_28275 [Anaerolineae bacterium]
MKLHFALDGIERQQQPADSSVLPPTGMSASACLASVTELVGSGIRLARSFWNTTNTRSRR